MPRIRTIKPAFWTDEKLAHLAPLVRMTFLGLISAMADDAGRCKGDIRLVKASVWPLDDDVTPKILTSHIDQLCRAGRIMLYEVEGARYIQITNWKRHQRIDKPRPSELPEPPAGSGSILDDSENDPRIIVEESARDREEEGNRNGIGSGAGAERAPSAAPAAPLMQALALPQGVLDFLGMFYEPALSERQRDRYRDIVGQLWDTIDPTHPGPKIRGGIRVKARDKDHLEFVCRAVMKDPPMDRDKAVVFVLKRLTDPPPGPTPAERHKAETVATIAEEDIYQREMRAAGVKWSKANPADYQPILAAVNREFANQTNSFMQLARESALSQRCARAAGFPEFDKWRAKRQESAA